MRRFRWQNTETSIVDAPPRIAFRAGDHIDVRVWDSKLLTHSYVKCEWLQDVDDVEIGSEMLLRVVEIERKVTET